jgi:hypothetical protein
LLLGLLGAAHVLHRFARQRHRFLLRLDGAVALLIGAGPLLVGAGALAVPLAAQEVACTRDHPGRQHRLESVAKRGDARMAWSAAAHTTLYAVEKYGLRGHVTDAQVKAAQDATYEFLKWKLGNATAVAAQFVSAGYQHFDKGYADEAAAALVGFELPRESGGHSTFYLPPELVDLWMMSEKLQNAGKAYLLNAFFGIPKPLTQQVLDYIVEQEGAAAKRLGFNIPKDYDFPNELLLAQVEAKRDPARLRARFLAAVEEARRVESGAPARATVEAPRARPRPPGARP